MNWSQLKKRITSHLVESVRNRIDFGMTHYGNSYYMSRAWIRIDKKEILNMSTPEFYNASCYCETERNGRDSKTRELNGKNVFTAHGFGNALFNYLNLSTEKILESEITLKDKSLGLTHFFIIINVPGRAVRSPEGYSHNCWVRFDEVTEDRVKGRFGGTFRMDIYKPGEAKDIEITDGVFDLPVKKCYQYK